MRGLLLAIAFLTRVPTGAHAGEARDLARAVPWFPVVGALIGFVIALVYAGAVNLWPPFPAAVLAIAVGLLMTGAFHEDGLADTVDAFGAGRGREQTLQILKDPTLGTFGVLALIVSFLLRAGAIATFTTSLALVALPGAHALSRAVPVALLGWVKPAGEGLGASYGESVTRPQTVVGVLAGIGLAILLLGEWSPIPVATCAVVGLVFARLSVTKAGGITGDVLGATQQVSEVAILLALAALAT